VKRLRERWLSVRSWLALRDLAWLAHPLLAFLATRAALWIAAYLGEVAIPGLDQSWVWHKRPDNLFLDVWARWDSGWYLSIVERGYAYTPGAQSSVAFFPLYPVLVRALGRLSGGYVVAGILVSHASLLAALIYLYLLTRELNGDRLSAERAVFYAAAFPSAFFLSAVYTESLFLLTTVASAYHARRQHWVWAAFWGMLASATRIPGLAMLGVVGLEWLRAHGWTLSTAWRAQAWRNLWRGLRVDWGGLLVLALVPLGLLSYMVFLERAFGDPWAFRMAHEAWDRHMAGPYWIIRGAVDRLIAGSFRRGDIPWRDVIDLAAFALVVGLVPFIWWKVGDAYALYALGCVLLPMWSHTMSMTRYALVAFPVYVLLGRWGKHRAVDRGLVAAFAILLGMLVTINANWYFVG
jgi:hypothetical protein